MKVYSGIQKLVKEKVTKKNGIKKEIRKTFPTL
jgi:hypothetical protein